MNEIPDNAVFLPLKGEFYHAFIRKDKTYELRGVFAQFKPNRITKGRPVIVSRGYSTPDRVCGVIGDVRIFNSIDEAMKSDIWSKIVPDSIKTDVQPLLKYYRERYTQFIAFEIVFNQKPLIPETDNTMEMF